MPGRGMQRRGNAVAEVVAGGVAGGIAVATGSWRVAHRPATFLEMIPENGLCIELSADPARQMLRSSPSPHPPRV